MGVYEGTLRRRYGATWGRRPPVPGVNPEHLRPDPDPDPFSPEITTPPDQAGNVWSPDELADHTGMRDQPIHHWTQLVPPPPTNTPTDLAMDAQQSRLLANHGLDRYRPDVARAYRHATEGREIEWTEGRMPTESGIDVPDAASWLVMGKNAFDRTNVPNEVYGAETTGRYRLSWLIRHFGSYAFPVQKQGQDAELRAYEGLHPAFPADKPRIHDSAPYTAPSFGTTTWVLPPFQVPRLFALPSETAVVDRTMAVEDEPTVSQFDDGGRL